MLAIANMMLAFCVQVLSYHAAATFKEVQPFLVKIVGNNDYVQETKKGCL
jgi:hypothetical protein